MMKFRADIQGLRAVAVLLVILFHVDPSWMPGGYVGVDVFFVISGFLITSMLQRDIDAGRFSLIHFYERRVRRIAPALLGVIAATTVVVPFFMLSTDLRDYSRSLLGAISFSSNLYFYLTMNYFSSAAALKPLLHTWSLAVEEQFYIFFPLLLAYLGRRSRRRVLHVLAALAVGSLLVSVCQTGRSPNAAYYLPFARLWELLAGSLLALTIDNRQSTIDNRQKVWRHWLGGIGNGAERRIPF